MDELKELLIRSFDETLLPGEAEKLEKALLHSEELRREKKELEDMRRLLSEFSPSFDSGFSQSVLEKTAYIDEATDTGLYPLFKRFALGAVAAIVLLLVSVYFTDGTISTDAVLGLTDLTSDNLLLALSTF